MPEEEKSAGGGSNSVFDSLIENNTKQRPSLYYNVGVYVLLYNRIKNDLMNNNEYGDPTAFDTQINKKIREGLAGSPAEVRAFLHKYDLDHLVKIYNGPATEKEKKEYYYEISSENLSKNLDRVMTLAKNLARVKYGKDKQMLTNDDIREILLLKEKKSEKTQFEAARALTSFAGIDESGKIKGGELTKQWLHASRKLKGMKQNLNRGRLKAVGWTALVLGGAALTGVFAFATMGIGSAAAGGLIGALYTTSQGAGALGGIIATGLSGWGTWTGLKGMIRRFSQNWKDRKKLKHYQHSKGKYAEAKEDDYENMGYGRIKERYFAYTGIKHFFDSKTLQPDAKKFRNADGSYEPDAYIPKKYRKPFHRYIEDQEALVGHGMRDLKNMQNNIKHHKFVASQDINNDGSEFGFYGLMNHMNRGVEGYEVSNLTADEVVLNYSDVETQNRLHRDRIAEHKGYDSSLQYLMGNLKEVQNYEQKFVDAGLRNEYDKLMTLFSTKFSDAFNNALFENAYTSRMIGNASHIMDSEVFKKMISSIDSQENQEYMMSTIGFLIAERDNNNRSVKILADDVEVGVEHQIDMSRNSIVAGCVGLGDGSTESAAAAEKIASMTTCSIAVSSGKVELDRNGNAVRKAAPELIAEIDALPNEKTKKYLRHMLKVKMAACSVDGMNYVNSLSGTNRTSANLLMSSIMSLSSSEDAQDIRNDISNSSLPEEVKTNLNEILDAQIDGLETAIRDEARVNAIKGIKKGSSKFNEIIKKIDEIKSFKKSDLHDLWIEIERVDDQNLMEYLTLRFKDKVTHELVDFARTTANFAGDAESQIAAIKTFINDMKSLYAEDGKDSFIDKWQFDECMKSLNNQITSTMESYLRNIELDFLQDTDKKKRALGDLVTLDVPNGIANYFKLNTPESQAIFERANRFVRSANVYEFMTVASVGGYVGLKDTESGDIQTALGVYFSKDRNATDNLLNVFEKFNHNVGQLDFNQDIDFISALPERDSSVRVTFADGSSVEYPTFKGLDTCKKVIGSGNLILTDSKFSFIMSTIDSLKSDSFLNSTAEERLAALTVLKRKIAGMIRLQMVQLYQKKGSGCANYTDFYQTYRDDLNNNLSRDWVELAKLVDNLIRESKSMLPIDSRVGSTIDPNTVTIVQSVCQPANYSTIVNQQTMMGS